MPRTKKLSDQAKLTKKRHAMALHRSRADPVHSIIFGSMHQGSDMFDERNIGRQCTCTSLMSLIMSQNKSPIHWTPSDLDAILFSGDKLYTENHGNQAYLMVTELPTTVEYANNSYTVQYHDSYSGSFSLVSTSVPFYTLLHAINHSQAVSPYMMLIIGRANCATASMIMHMGEDAGFFVYDSHSRNEIGMPIADGSSVVLNCKSLEKLVNYIKQLSDAMGSTADQFELTPVTVRKDTLYMSACAEEKRTRKREQMRKYLSQPHVKKARSERETIQRADHLVQTQRQKREAAQRLELAAKRQRLEREAAQRSEPAAKTQRREREAAQRSEPAAKTQRREREAAQRSEPEAKRKTRERVAAKRSEPAAKRKTREREAAQRSEPAAKTQRREREAAQRSEPEAKRKTRERVAAQRSEPAAKRKTREREAAQRSEPAAKTQRREREVAQRSEPEAKRKTRERVAAQRSEPAAKRKTRERETAQRSEPAAKTQRREREAAQRSEPEAKRKTRERVAAQRSEPAAKRKTREREAAQRSEPAAKTQRREREAAQRSEPAAKTQRREREAAQRSEPVIRLQRREREKTHGKKPETVRKKDMQDKRRRKMQKKQKTNITNAVESFKAKCAALPRYVCCLCRCIRFKDQTVKFKESAYKNYAELLDKCEVSDSCDEICKYCHNYLKKGKMPSIAYYGNTLATAAMPDDLADLNTLEQFLLTPVIPFMKVINLPKGYQRGIHGQVVCVQSDLNKVASSLPRPVDDTGLIKVKLKRKLRYKGHHLYQQVRTDNVMRALQHLKKHHSAFKGMKYILCT